MYYMVVMGGSYFICPMMFSRILSADTAENARKSSFMSGTGMLIFALALTFIGLWVSATGFDPGKQDPLNAIASLALPKVLGVLLIFGLLAAIISTADTVLLTASSIIQNDLIRKPSVAMVRFWIVGVGFAAAAVAFNHTDIIGLLMKTYNGYTAGLVPALFVAIMAGRKPSHAGILSLGIIFGYLLGTAGSFSIELGSLLSLEKASVGILGKALPLAGMAVSAILALGAYAKAPVRR
jgi:SSS family solute:Na+ symporter